VVQPLSARTAPPAPGPPPGPPGPPPPPAAAAPAPGPPAAAPGRPPAPASAPAPTAPRAPALAPGSPRPGDPQAAPAPAPAPGGSAEPAGSADPSGPSAPGYPATTGDPADPVDTTDPEETRKPDSRALTRALFAQLTALEPGTPEHTRVRTALIEANLPLVRYAAARFRSRNEPMEDVLQVGTIGLIHAIDRFDPARGVQFPTFAMPTVVGEIKRYFRDNVRTVHVPRRLHELWAQVSGATEDLTVRHGRAPTTAEIAAHLKVGEDEVRACREAGRSYYATSLEAAQEGDGMPGLLDRLGYEDPALAGVEHRDLVRHLLVQLPEREQRILMLRYYRNMTQSQISAELGLSQMHVSRLLSRSFARLRSANRIDS